MKNKVLPLLVSFLLIVASVNAQFTKLHDMQNGEPNGSLTIVGNAMYGTGYEGGAHGFGYLFSIKKDGTGFTDIFDFADTGTVSNKCNGKNPWGDLTYINGRLYGFTEYGGLGNKGSIFSINTDGSGYKELWDFTAATGKWPYQGALTLYGKKLFGTTNYGGASNLGAIFAIDTTGNNYRDIYDFRDTGHVVGNYDGSYPYSSYFVVANNRLYGMTYNGGAHGDGEIFAIDTDGTSYKDILDFDDSQSGSSPGGGLLLVGGRFFGMTSLGNSVYNYGTVFSVDTDGTSYKTLLEFDDTNGQAPNAGLAFSRGKLYGTTYIGGANGDGVLFSLDTGSLAYATLFSFDSTGGAFPEGNITLVKDTLYGLTQYGGAKDSGVIFRYVDTSISAGIAQLPVVTGAVVVYPNPNNGKFVLEFSHPELVSGSHQQVEIYNMLGEKVYSQFVIPNSQFVINLQDQPNGIYLYRIISASGALVGDGKLVIEK